MRSAVSISVYTIAAPSPGNAEFADYYNALFADQSGHSTAFRFFNSLDVVLNAWGKPRYRRDILSTAGVLPSRHHEAYWPRRNSESRSEAAAQAVPGDQDRRPLGRCG